jgi:RNA polymerase sigma-70 factor, ECF subfamily
VTLIQNHSGKPKMDYSTAWQDEKFMPDAEQESGAVTAPAENSDRRLVELVLAGDETAFEQIFERYKRLVAAIASRYFQRPEQIEEIIQIGFTKAFFELKRFRGRHDASLASWLGKITTNACLDALRSQTRKSENLLCDLSEAEVEILFAAAPAGDKNTEKSLVERDLAEKLLSRLAADDRAILQMLDAEEMSVTEVAEITGWSNSKIKIRAFRARNALRKILRKFL